MVKAVGVGHCDDDAPIRICRIEPFDPAEMDLDIFQSHNGIRVWSHLPVGSLETEPLIERNSFVKFPAR
jgi:hypothetical protein